MRALLLGATGYYRVVVDLAMRLPATLLKTSADKLGGRATPVLLGVVVLLVAGSLLTGILMELAGRATTHNITQATDLRLRMQSAYAAMLDMETGVRGYVITGDETFLDPYRSAQSALPTLWEELEADAEELDRQSGGDSLRVSPPLGEMRARAEAWQREIAEPQIALRRSGRAQEALDDVATSRGKAMFDSFRQAGFEFGDQIETNLSAYNAQLELVRGLQLGLLVGLGGLTLLIAAITAQVARRESRLQEESRRAIEAERARLRTVVEYLPMAVRLVDAPGGNVILQNRAADLLLPLQTWNSLKPEDRPLHFSFTNPDGTPLSHNDLPGISARREGVTVTDFEFQMSTAHTGSKTLLASSAPLRNAEGKVTAAVVVLQDVTRLKELDRRKDEFIATAAHELRNPLAALSGYNQLLQRMITRMDDVPPNVTQHLSQMGRQIRRINALVDRLLDASRIELGKLVLTKSRADLVEIARSVVANAQATDEGAHNITVVVQDAEVEGEWDATRLEQVLTNLVSNAVRYTPVGTDIEVRICNASGRTRVEVADRGPGVPPEQAALLFDRYYQTGALKPDMLPANDDARLRKGQGLGLGLYISKEIIRAHGGQIGVEPNPGGGSVFWFTLPTDDY